MNTTINLTQRQHEMKFRRNALSAVIHLLLLTSVGSASVVFSQEIQNATDSPQLTVESTQVPPSNTNVTTATNQQNQTSVNPTLAESVKAGLTTSPVLSSKMHALEASMLEGNVVFGEMLPTVDARAQTGRERNKFENGETNSFNTTSYGIEARQNLFNGFASQARYLASFSDVMAEYYRLLESSNNIVMESAMAHINVARYQAMTKLAEQNVTYHQELMKRIEEKVESGVDRPADLEQARSRYTLALSNLATEKSNTFSAMADYQKAPEIIWPNDFLGEYVIETNFEIANPERLIHALNNHQMIKAANSEIYSAEYDITSAKEGFFPRIDLRAKADHYDNFLSTGAERQIASIDLLATMNLYRGGADEAAREAAIRRSYQTKDQKNLVCKTVRRNTQVALYDVVNMEKKLDYFKRQANSISNARTAYEEQFKIGRRDLLDLLNAENEFYQAQRNLIAVEADLSIAKLRLLGASGQLISLFGVDDLITTSEPTKRNVILYNHQMDAAQVDTECPQSVLNLESFSLPSIGFEPGLKFVKNESPDAKNAVAVKTPDSNLSNFAPFDVAQVGNTNIQIISATTNNIAQEKELDPSVISPQLIKRAKEWAFAWQTRDINGYIGFYSTEFKPENGGTFNAWQDNRKQRIAVARDIQVSLSEIQVIPSFDETDIYETSFIQDYSAANYQERSRKVLTWKRQSDGSWLIIRERNLPENTVLEVEPEKVNLKDNLAQLY